MVNSFTLPDNEAGKALRQAELLGRKPDHVVANAVSFYDGMLQETWKGHQLLVQDPRTGRTRVIRLRDGAPPVDIRSTFDKWVQDRPALLFLILIWMWTAIASGSTMFFLLATGHKFDEYWYPIKLLTYISHGLSLALAGFAHFGSKRVVKKATKRQEE